MADIKQFEEWCNSLEESEIVPPVSQPAAPAPTDAEEEGPEPTKDLTPEEQAAQAEEQDVEPDPDSEPNKTDLNNTESLSELDQFTQIDKERRDAIKAFKDKQKEYLEIPIETRKNPPTDEDKQKVETMRNELFDLNRKMNSAVEAYEKFNRQMLGLNDDEDDENDEP